jgi:Kef-type K+ transport system membrane component KefB
MNILLSLVFLVLIAYVGSVIFHRFPIKNNWLNSITDSGNLYLLLGFAIGPNVLNLIDGKIIDQLNVLYALVLGWAGFLIGLQTNFKNLKRFRQFYYYFATSNFLIAFCLSSVLLILIFPLFQTKFENIEIIILATASAVTSPIMLGIFLRDHKVHGKMSHLLQFVSGFDNILGVIILGIIMTGLSNLKLFNNLSIGFYSIFIPIALSGIASYLYYILAKEFKKEQENFLLLISLLIFILGIALYLNQSILFTAFLFGAGISNLPINTKKLYLSIQQIEKPLYILLLIFVGVSINLISYKYIILLAAFLVIHLLVIFTSGYMANLVIKNKLHLSNLIGLANLGMGGLSLAIILDFHLTNPSDFSNLLLFILAISIIVNDLVSYKFLERLFLKNTKKIGHPID